MENISDEDLLELLSSNTKTIHALASKQLELVARIEATEIGLRIFAKKLGICDDLLFEQLRKLQANLHQKRLEDLEDHSPGAAASASCKLASHLLDQALLDILAFDADETDDDGDSQHEKK